MLEIAEKLPSFLRPVARTRQEDEMSSDLSPRTSDGMSYPFLVLLIAAPILLCSSLWAQVGLSTLRGTVADPSGGVVPGVKITIEEVATNIIARTVVTDSQGNYEAPALKQGIYRLKAGRKGFETYVVNDLYLASNEAKELPTTAVVNEVAKTVYQAPGTDGRFGGNSTGKGSKGDGCL